MKPWLIALPGIVAACGADGASELIPNGGTIALAGGIPVALTVDDAYVYWTVAGPDGSVLRAPRGGGDAEVLAGGLGNPQDRVVVDERHLYVVSAPGGLFKLPKDGSGPAESIEEPVFDAASDGGEIYWSTGPTIARAPSSSGPATTVLEGLPAADVLALDGQHLYWIDRLGGELHRAARDGTGAILFDTMLGDAGPTIAMDDAYVYWGVNGQLARLDKADGTVLTLAPDYGSFGPAVADGLHLYSFRHGLDAMAGEIVRLSVDGGEIRPAIEGIYPSALAVDDAFLYWGDAPDAAPATIRRAPK